MSKYNNRKISTIIFFILTHNNLIEVQYFNKDNRNDNNKNNKCFLLKQN